MKTDDIITTLVGKTWNFGSINHQNYIISVDTLTKLSKLMPGSSNSNGWKIHRGICSKGVSFESAKQPGYYLRHQGFVMNVQKLENHEDFCFYPIPGLTSCTNQLLFQSVNFPRRYLRHQSFLMELQASDGSKLFEEDSTFIKEQNIQCYF